MAVPTIGYGGARDIASRASRSGGPAAAGATWRERWRTCPGGHGAACGPDRRAEPGGLPPRLRWVRCCVARWWGNPASPPGRYRSSGVIGGKVVDASALAALARAPRHWPGL